MQPASKGIPVLMILQGLSKYHGKKYCYPSQLKIMELLKARVNVQISIATLNRYLRVIEDQKWIRRIRRIKRDPVRGIMFQSTIYIISREGYRLLARTGIKIWFFVKKAVKKIEPAKKAPGVIQFSKLKRKFVYNKNPAP